MNVWLPRGLQKRTGKHRAFVAGALHSSTGNVVAKLFATFSALYAAKTLGPEGFGQFSFMLATAGMASGVGVLGLGTIITREVSALRSRCLKEFSAAAVFVAVVTTILVANIVCAVVIAFDLAETMPRTFAWIPVILLWSVGIAGNLVVLSITVGERRFARAARFMMTRSAVVACGMFVGAFLRSPFITSVLVCGAELAVFVMSCSVSFLTIRTGIGFNFSEFWKKVRSLYVMGTGAGSAAVAVQVSTWGAQALLVAQPNGASMLGAMSLGQRVVLLITLLPTSINSASLPLLSSRRKGAPTIKLALLVPVALALFGTICGGVLVVLGLPYFSKDYALYSTAILLFVVSALPQAGKSAIGTVAVARSMIGVWVASDLILAALLAGVGLVTIPIYGLYGFGLAYLLSFSLASLYLLWSVDRVSRRHPIPAQ